MKQHWLSDTAAFVALVAKRAGLGVGGARKAPQPGARGARPRSAALIGAGVILALSGCGGDSESAPAPQTGAAVTRTLGERVADAEASGALPKLDRSDSLAGPDNDANGVRDDVERYLAARFQSPDQLKAAMQTAKAVQAMVTADPTDKIRADAIDLSSMRGIHCMSQRFPADPGANSQAMVSLLEKITANTKVRAIAYLNYSDSRDGTVSSVPMESTCD